MNGRENEVVISCSRVSSVEALDFKQLTQEHVKKSLTSYINDVELIWVVRASPINYKNLYRTFSWIKILILIFLFN